MARSLVIVESPAKARTINRYLGKDYMVKSSIGHIRDLPTGGKASDPKARAKEAAKTRKLSVKAKDDLRKQRAARNSCVGWAWIRSTTGKRLRDPARKRKSGRRAAQARREIGPDLSRYRPRPRRRGDCVAPAGNDRRRSRSLSPRRIQRNHAQSHPGSVRQTRPSTSNRVNAQQARRFLDRVVGFELSPLLWAKVARGLSAGRVQSVAVRLIVEREREIRAFMPEEYWEAFADWSGARRRRGVSLPGVEGPRRELRPDQRRAADDAMARLRGKPFAVRSREDQPTTRRPNRAVHHVYAATGREHAAGFSVKKTMTMAQRLYEAGYITYMRTDSTNLSTDAVASVRENIEKEYGEQYLPEQANAYASKAAAQEAHEAIRPSNVGTAPIDAESAWSTMPFVSTK